MENLQEIAKDLKRTILRMAHKAGSAHVGCSFSIADIVTTLYFEVMNVSLGEDRDRFILSKAHSSMALYSALAKKGIIDKECLDGYHVDHGRIPGHLERMSCAGVEVSAGSLGHGMPMAVGMAHGLKLKNNNARVFTIIGDGESQEGSIWEAAMMAPFLKLDNLTVFLDNNNLQGFGRPTELLSYEPIEDKWKAFNWDTQVINGHDYEQIKAAATKKTDGKPKVVICKTIKGKGVSFMENQMKWHYFRVTDEYLKQALEELK
jgi:transketolase